MSILQCLLLLILVIPVFLLTVLFHSTTNYNIQRNTSENDTTIDTINLMTSIEKNFPNISNANESTHDGIFWDISDDNMLKLLDKIELDLRIFIYPIPPGVPIANRYALPNGQLHFQTQNLIITYLQRRQAKENSTFVVSDPSLANVFIIDMILEGLDVSGYNKTERHIKPIIYNVLHNYPYYNRSAGYDHFVMTVYDNGVLCNGGLGVSIKSYSKLFKLIGNASFIGNYGQDKDYVKDYDNNEITCFRVNHDIVIPQMIWNETYDSHKSRKQFGVLGYQRKYDSCFNGRFHGRRKSLDAINQTKDYDYINKGYEKFELERMLYNCLYGYNPCGMACWSMRLYDGIAYGSTPILIADGTVQAFEKFIDWRKFTIKMFQSSFDDLNKLGIYRKFFRLQSDEYYKQLNNIFTNLKMLPTKKIHMPIIKENITINNQIFQDIQNNYLFNKMKYMNKAMHWFQYNDLNDKRNAFRLLFLEIWCRVYVYRYNNQSIIGLPGNYSPFSIEYMKYENFNQDHKICNRKADYTGRIEYF